MTRNPELEDFERRVASLSKHKLMKGHIKGDEVALGELSIEKVDELAREDAGYYFLISAAGLNRTALKRSMNSPTARIVQQALRRAYAIKERLPLRASFKAVQQKATSLRERDLKRKHRGAVEALLRERLKSEDIPISMSPPIRRVPALLITQRKPDGVYPDPDTGRAPLIYLEIKSIRRVSDDIQKRLYEIAESSMEMKTLYGDLKLTGFSLRETTDVAGNSELRKRLRAQLTAATPVVVAFFICPRAEAERYREGAEAFIDRVFFQEEVDECIEYLRQAVQRFENADASR